MDCEEFVKKYLPVLRKEIAKMLYYKKGYSQNKISKLLKVSQAEVSMYIKGSRGKRVKIPKEILEKVLENIDKDKWYCIACKLLKEYGF